MGSSGSSLHSSKVPGNRQGGQMRGRTFEASAPVVCGANDATTGKRVKESGSLGGNDSKREKEKRGIGQAPDKSLEKQLTVALAEGSQAEEDTKLDTLTASRSTGERLPEIRSTPEDQRQELANLALAAYTRFESAGRVTELTKAIEYWETAIAKSSSWPKYRPALLSNLGCAYESRFSRMGELSDLNKAIELQTQAVSLLLPYVEALDSLNNLAITYRLRFERLGDLSDLEKSLELQAGAVSIAPDDHMYKPAYLNNLGIVYETRFKYLGELSDLSKAIESQAQAVSLTPDEHQDRPGYLNNLGNSYHTRFERLGELWDLNKAIESQAQAVSLTHDGHPDKPGRFSNLGNSYQTRFLRLGELSDLHRAIKSKTQAVSLTPDDHPKKPACLSNLGASYEIRFGELNELSDLNRAIELQARAISLTPDGHHSRPMYLNNLGSSYQARFKSLGELPDLNKAIDLQVQTVSLTPDDHSGKPGYLSNLGLSYETRFGRVGEPLDLNKAINFKAQAVSLTPDGHPDKPGYLYSLGNSYEARFRRLNDPSAVQSAVSSFRAAGQSRTGSPWMRFYACRDWARLAALDGTSSPLPAYHHAVQLLPQLVWIGSTLGRRYELIAQAGDFAAEAASRAIAFAAYDLALDWLEAGRSIVWGQITQLRTSFDQLVTHDAELATQLRQVGRELERAGSRSSFTLEAHNDDRGFVDEVNSHIQLALNWDRLLTMVRSIPGFEEFLYPPKSSQLLSAAKYCPIAVVNIHQSRCDALIIQPNTKTISHVPLTAFSKEMATSARKHLVSLVGQRGFKKAGRKPESVTHKHSPLEESLENLWLGIVNPVLEYLGFINESPSDDPPHITWCTTGPLSFLPLHAAGCYNQSRSSTFDHVISSYTPTLSALLSSQAQSAGTPCGIVAVGQEHTPGFNSLPCTIDELKAIKRHAHANAYLQLENSRATIDQVLDAMDQFSWVHMACHGTQSVADPTQSAFHLHDGPLTLATITKKSLTNKGLAFLSACQTATGDENLPDEAVHLAAGMLIAGYPSVIGTMWSIVDEDGPVVANMVYSEMLRSGNMDHTKAARALHRAVAVLRAKVGEKDIARWAPFIHFGS